MNCRENRYIFFYPPPGGNFRGSKNQKSGKCHERPRKIIKKCNPHPTQPHPIRRGTPTGGGVRVEHFKVTKPGRAYSEGGREVRKE